VPKLVDTTIRVLGQEPLAGAVPTSVLLELATILDRAGFAYLEVSGGGVFDSAVHRGVESPWERIRALKARTTTPLALAVRGHFLVSSRPVGGELVRRFVEAAAASGVDVFRLHDPLNDPANLTDAAEAIVAAGRVFDVGVLYGSSRRAAVLETARRLPELGASRVLLHDPAGMLQPHRAGELVRELRDLSGLPVGFYSQGAGRNALSSALEAARAGADLVACAVYPVALASHRISAESAAEALAGLGFDPGVDADVLWAATDLIDEHIGDAPVAPLVPRIAARAARRKLPVGVVSAVDAQLRARGAGGRLDEVLEELERVRLEAGSPPLGAPIGQVVASQALVNVLGANRYGTIVDELRDLVLGRYGHTPGPVDPALTRAVELVAHAAEDEPPVDLDALAAAAGGLAANDEELLLLALFGDEAEPLLRSIRLRAGGANGLAASADQAREERIREVVRIVEESDIGEITVEEDGIRVRVRRAVEATAAYETAGVPAGAALPAAETPELPAALGNHRIESPMVGTFYRGPQPGAPAFVEEGDPVVAGQTLCILEAMKLLNEVKSEIDGIVLKIHVANAEPVEYGQLLIELEPLPGQPLDV
jgi:oxaloacetate decarboxylase alpha subunit